MDGEGRGGDEGERQVGGEVRGQVGAGVGWGERGRGRRGSMGRDDGERWGEGGCEGASEREGPW